MGLQLQPSVILFEMRNTSKDYEQAQRVLKQFAGDV